MKYVTIEGTITLKNGKKIQFELTSDNDYGYNQWGNSKEVLGQNVDLITALDKTLKEVVNQ